MFGPSAHVYDLLYSFKDYETESSELASLILERNPEAGSLLDVACGTGLHLWHLRERFPDVAGVDVSPEMLAVARERLPGVPLTEADMRSFDVGRSFDAVTCLFSSIGYMLTVEDLELAIARMAAHLEPGGVLVVDGWVRPERWRDPGTVHALGETGEGMAAARVSRSHRDGSITTLEMRYLIATADGFEQSEETHSLRLFTDEDYRSAFEKVGLGPEVVPAPTGQDRDRYVAVVARGPGPA